MGKNSKSAKFSQNMTSIPLEDVVETSVQELEVSLYCDFEEKPGKPVVKSAAAVTVKRHLSTCSTDSSGEIEFSDRSKRIKRLSEQDFAGGDREVELSRDLNLDAVNYSDDSDAVSLVASTIPSSPSYSDKEAVTPIGSPFSPNRRPQPEDYELEIALDDQGHAGVFERGRPLLDAINSGSPLNVNSEVAPHAEDGNEGQEAGTTVDEISPLQTSNGEYQSVSLRRPSPLWARIHLPIAPDNSSDTLGAALLGGSLGLDPNESENLNCSPCSSVPNSSGEDVIYYGSSESENDVFNVVADYTVSRIGLIPGVAVARSARRHLNFLPLEDARHVPSLNPEE